MTRDRTVHATTEDGREIVRYDRSGKWFWETVDHRKHIDLEGAVRLATLPGSKVKLGKAGRASLRCVVPGVDELREGTILMTAATKAKGDDYDPVVGCIRACIRESVGVYGDEDKAAYDGAREARRIGASDAQLRQAIADVLRPS